LEEAKKALGEVKKFWELKLGALQFETPNTAMDILLNGWLLYQVVSCRLWTRSGFYQSGGAYGFRDQLQDSISLTHIWPEATRNQILLHSRHQFIEGMYSTGGMKKNTKVREQNFPMTFYGCPMLRLNI